MSFNGQPRSNRSSQSSTNSDQSQQSEFLSRSTFLMKNLPESLQNDTIIQQLLHPKTSEKFDYQANTNVQRLMLKDQPKENAIVKIEGNIVTQKIVGNNELTYDQRETVVQSQWLNCAMDPRDRHLVQSKDGVFIKHYNELSLNPAFTQEEKNVLQYQSASLASSQVLSHAFTNVFIYRPKEMVFNVDLNRNVIYPEPRAVDNPKTNDR